MVWPSTTVQVFHVAPWEKEFPSPAFEEILTANQLKEIFWMTVFILWWNISVITGVIASGIIFF